MSQRKTHKVSPVTMRKVFSIVCLILVMTMVLASCKPFGGKKPVNSQAESSSKTSGAGTQSSQISTPDAAPSGDVEEETSSSATSSKKGSAAVSRPATSSAAQNSEAPAASSNAPDVSSEPVASSESDVSSEPAASSKPAVSSQPAASSKPAVSSQPAASSKPAVSSQPVEPTTVAPEPTSAVPEPTTVTPEPTTAAPEPTSEAAETTSEAAETTSETAETTTEEEVETTSHYDPGDDREVPNYTDTKFAVLPVNVLRDPTNAKNQYIGVFIENKPTFDITINASRADRNIEWSITDYYGNTVDSGSFTFSSSSRTIRLASPSYGYFEISVKWDGNTIKMPYTRLAQMGPSFYVANPNSIFSTHGGNTTYTVEAGVRYTRSYLWWRYTVSGSNIGQMNSSSVESAKREVANLKANNMSMIATIDGFPTSLNTPAKLMSEDSMEKFASWVKQIVGIYKDVTHIYEVLNEPDLGPTNMGLTGAQMVEFFKVEAKAIKEADPDAIVLGPGTWYTFNKPYLDSLIEEGTGKHLFEIKVPVVNAETGEETMEWVIDKISVHCYRGGRYNWIAPERCNLFTTVGNNRSYTTNPVTGIGAVASTWLPALRAYAESYREGLSEEIYDTESGFMPFSDGDIPGLSPGQYSEKFTEKLQADYLVRAYILHMADNFKVFSWYSFQDWNDDRSGLFRIDGPGDHANMESPRHSYATYANMTRQLYDMEYKDEIYADRDNSIYGAHFANDKKETYVFWGDMTTRLVSFKNLEGLTIVDVVGNPIIPTPIDDNHFAVIITDSPVFIRSTTLVDDCEDFYFHVAMED